MKHGWIAVGFALAVIASPALAASDPGAATADAGKDIYSKKCVACHSANGVAKPTAKGSANLNDPAWQGKATDEEIANVITHGKNKMPKYDKLTAAEVSSLVAYVRTLK